MNRMVKMRWFGKMVSSVLVLSMFLSLLPAQPLYAETGNGSQEMAGEAAGLEYIDINSVEDLLALSEKCYVDSWSEGKYISLKSDLNLAGVDFKPIPVFSGTFDGGGHIISGFDYVGDGYVTGFFRYIGSTGIVRNLTLRGSVDSENERECVGSICGINYGEVRGCTFQGTVSGRDTVGGIVGINESTATISGCAVKGRVTGYYSTGGITGINHGAVNYCTNRAGINDNSAWVWEDDEMSGLGIFDSLVGDDDVDLYSGVDTGGIAGFSDGIISRCTNEGTVGYEHTGYNIGGIAGRQSGIISLCVNNGTVYGRKDIGGIAGQMEPFIEIDEAESLRNAINKLHDLIEKTIDDMQNTKDAMKNDTDVMQTYADGAIDTGDALVSQITDFSDDNIDAFNALTGRMEHVMDMLPPVLDHMTAAGNGMSDLNNTIRNLTDALDIMGKLENSEFEGTDYDRLVLLSTVGGTLVSDMVSPKENDTVTITVRADVGYRLKEGSLSVKDAGGNDVAVTGDSDDKFTFTMPVDNVVVSAEFTYEGVFLVKSTVGGSVFRTVDGGRETFRAAADSGYEFSHFNVGGDQYNGEYEGDEGNEITLGKDEYLKENESVVVEAVFTEKSGGTHEISCVSSTGGSARSDKSSAAEGEEVTVTAAAHIGYKLDEIAVEGVEVRGSSSDASKYVFTMPGRDVTVKVTYAAETDSDTGVYVESSVGGSAYKTSSSSDRVTINLIPDSGYMLDSTSALEITVVAGRSVDGVMGDNVMPPSESMDVGNEVNAPSSSGSTDGGNEANVSSSNGSADAGNEVNAPSSSGSTDGENEANVPSSSESMNVGNEVNASSSSGSTDGENEANIPSSSGSPDAGNEVNAPSPSGSADGENEANIPSVSGGTDSGMGADTNSSSGSSDGGSGDISSAGDGSSGGSEEEMPEQGTINMLAEEMRTNISAGAAEEGLETTRTVPLSELVKENDIYKYVFDTKEFAAGNIRVYANFVEEKNDGSDGDGSGSSDTGYAVTTASSTGGQAAASLKSAGEGEKVYITPASGSGYVLKKLTVTGSKSGNDIPAAKESDGRQYSFIMPAEEVRVEAQFEPIHIIMISNVSGSASCSGNAEGIATLHVKPDSAYILEEAPVVTDMDGNAIPISQKQSGSYVYEFDITKASAPCTVRIHFEKQNKDQAVDTSKDNIKDAIDELEQVSSEMEDSVNRIQDITTDSEGNIKSWDQLTQAERDELTQEVIELTGLLGNVTTSTSSILSNLAAIYNILSPYVSDSYQDALDSIRAATDNVQAVIDSLQSAADGVRGIVNYINAQPDITFRKFGDDFSATKEAFHDQLKGLSDSIRILSDNASVNTDLLNEDLRAVNDQLNVVFNLLADRTVDIQELSIEELYEDVDDDHLDSITTGRVETCTNKGVVKGDINVGGIAGSMSIDDEDPEDSAAGKIEYEIGRRFITKCLVTDSVNEGYVTAKKDGAGGICGYMNHGIIVESKGYGSVKSTEGGYVGGICGESLTIIKRCYALCSVSGGSNVGGIAGFADTLQDCYAMASVEAEKGRSGAIAGQIASYEAVDADAAGEDAKVSGNYYVGSGVYGIDNISYVGVAEPISYRELLAVERIPLQFWHLNVIYRIDDTVLGVQEVPYGARLDNLDYPQIPGKEGFYGVWPDVSDQVMEGTYVVEGEYKENVTVVRSSSGEEVSTAETVRMKPYALVADVFTEDVVLSAVISSFAPPAAAEGKGNVVYELSLENSGIGENDSFAVRILNPYEKAVVYGYQNGTWTECESKVRGQYLQVEMTGTQEYFCVAEQKSKLMAIAGIAAGAGALFAAFLLLLKKVKPGKGRKKA